MAFDFPSSPAVGQQYQGYTWDGSVWKVASTGGKTQRFIFTPAAGTTTISGVDSNGLTLSYVPGSVEVSINGIWLDFSEYTATDGTSIALPSATASGDRIYVYALSSFSVLDPLNAKKNYIVNGAMMVSQENGTTAGTAAGYFAADQWTCAASHGGTFSFAQVASATPAGSPNRIRMTVTSADASVAATDHFSIRHDLEGLRVADLLFGTSSAKTIVVRFGVRAPAGTYGVTIQNIAGGTRGYTAEYTIAAGEANTDVVKTVVIPGDVTGTWAKDTSQGMALRFDLMTGSNFQQAAGSWAAGNFLGTANQFNFMGTNGNVFELFDVGLYEGVVAPPYTVPDYAGELTLCRRYYQTIGLFLMGGYAGSASSYWQSLPLSPPMRIAPTGALTTFVNPTYSNANSLTINDASTTNLKMQATAAAAGATWAACDLIKCNARL